MFYRFRALLTWWSFSMAATVWRPGSSAASALGCLGMLFGFPARVRFDRRPPFC